MAAPMHIMAAFFNSKMLCFAVLYLGLTIIVTDGARLSDPKILLPFHSSVVTNYTLQINLTRDEARNPSCYTWRSSRLDVASVRLINSTDNECSLSAEISAVSKSSMRKTSIVLVENKVTGEVLKCIVLVDNIHRIEIETTTRLLYLEDSPEEMMVRGYDVEGNVFSSLKGLEFQWSLHSDTSGGHDDIVDANSILRVLKFSESHYTTPPHIESIEDRGKQGDIILVEGIRTGSAYVWAKLRDQSYQSVEHSSVRLMVIANLMVSPPESYVLKYATVKYKVEQIRQNLVVAIQMPSTQYYLEVVNASVGTLDAATSITTALELGETEVKLNDKNIKACDALAQPSAMLHVVSASYLGFVVLPDRKWVLETGRIYTILIEVYDQHSHKIHPSDNVIIDALFPKAYFEVQFSTKNGTYHIVKTLKRGDTDVDGAFTTIVKQDGSKFSVVPAVKKSQFVEIFDPVIVQPELLFFPWDPVQQTTHKYELKATGGSGDYMWSTNDAGVVMVNKYGEIVTSARGEAEITASDRRNSLHKGLALVHILPPSGMEFRPVRVEIEVGSVLELPLDIMATLNGKQYSFNDCRHMPLNVTFTDPTVFANVEESSSLQDGSCRIIKVKGVQQGHTKVKAIYNHGNIKLESSITIAAYDSLVPVDPQKESVLTVGSSKEMIFSGGPQPWVLDSSKYFQILTADEKKNTIIQQVKTLGAHKKMHSFIVTCKNYGEQMITLEVGNEKTAKNQNPAVEHASVSLVCAEPVEIHLQPMIQYPSDLPPCPVSREPNQQIPVHCQRNLNLGVTVTDKNGRKFDNISSIEFDWLVSDTTLASLADDLESEITVMSSGGKKVYNYMTLFPAGLPGSITTTVTAARYKSDYLKFVQSDIPVRFSPKIRKSIELRLVEETVVSPGSLSIFNHPSNKVFVDVAKGSGFFHVVEGKAGIVDLKYLDKSKQIQFIPSKDGQMMVRVYDLCIATAQPAPIHISVSGIGSVQLYVMDKVEVGKDISARVEVLDITGHRLYASFFHLMGLALEPASDYITVKRDSPNDKDVYSAVYTVHGAIVGHTSLTAVAYLHDNRKVFSAAKPVEVFPPLELLPRNITLIIGALFQVLSRGGPSPQCTVLFSIKDSKTATVSSSGLLDGQAIGTTRVVGQAVGQDPETGETVIYSQDEVAVNVVRLIGVRIHVPLTRLLAGTTMPVYAVGLTEHETPFTFGSAVSPLLFKWSVNKKDVAQLHSVFHENGIQPKPEGNFAVQMVAMETGHVSVRLEVTAQSGQQQTLYDSMKADELQIQVFEQLEMVNPKVCAGELLMTTNTEAVLKTNRDGGAKMRYSVVSEDSSIVKVIDGVLVSGSISGGAALTITALEDSGVKQTLVIHVKVKPVSYMMLNSDGHLRTSGGQLSTVPRGATLSFTVTYHDDVGEKFYATNINMKYRCSRYDLVQVSHGLENNTLVMKTAAVGHTILKVWDSSKPWLVDYISIPVGEVIEPTNLRVQLGDIVCFTVPLSSDRSSAGSWNGSQSIILNNNLGVASAYTVGLGTVSYTVTDEVMTETEINVEAISEVNTEFDSDFITMVTDSKVYYVLVNLGKDSSVKGNNCYKILADEDYHPERIPFTCTLGINPSNQGVSASDYFNIQPVFISKLGKYACRISPVTTNLPQQISTVDVSAVVTVMVFQRQGQPEVKSVPLLVPVIPPFYIHNAEIHVSTLAPLSNVRLSVSPKTVDQIQVVVSDPSILEALPPESDPKSQSILIYPIKLIDTLALWEREQLDVWVDLIGQKTGQKVKIPVFIRLIGQKPDIDGYRRDVGWKALFRNILNNYHYWFILLIIIIVTALTVLFGYHAAFGPRYTAAANTTMAAGSPRQGSPPGPSYSPMSPAAYSQYYPPQSPTSSSILWSTGYTPIDGSTPSRRRSPIQQISPS